MSQRVYVESLRLDEVLGTGAKTIAAVGVREKLAEFGNCSEVMIQAKAGNTNGVWVGGPTVAVNSGIELAPAGTLTLNTTELTKVWLDTDTAGNGVTYIYWGR